MKNTKKTNNISANSKSSKRKRGTMRFASLKPVLRANGLSLLPLALRPGLSKSKFQNFYRVIERRRKYSKTINLLFLEVKFTFKIASFIIISLLFITYISSSSVSAASVTLTIPSSSLSLDISPSSGTIFKKSTPGIISISTDSSYGYTFTIQSKTGNDLVNGINKLSSISSNLSESDYESSEDNNTWGYMPSKLNSSTNTNFLPGPTTDPTTLDVTDSSSENTDYNLTLATKVDDTIPSGSYSNTFILTTTSNDPPNDGIMQNWDGCSTLTEHQVVNLLDIRDDNIYSVSKLKDGKCWMTKNLAIGNNEQETELTSEDSDVSGNFILPKGNTKGFKDYETSDIYIDNTYGGYYTWHAATAGTSVEATNFNQKASSSICPKGWRLPIANEYLALVTKYGGNNSDGSAALRSAPVNFVYPGIYEEGLLKSQGAVGDYWSSTGYSYYNSYHFRIRNNDAIGADLGGTIYYGNSIRCISRSNDEEIIDIGTMQTVEQWGDNVQEGKTYRATDIRDNKEYTVARLKDGKLWMTQNLSLGDSYLSNRTLTSADTDTSSDYTLPISSNKGFTNNLEENVYVASWGDIYLHTTGYYTWNAATAGSGNSISTDGQNASSSICPKGWRLPTGGSGGEFESMLNTYGSSSDYSSWLDTLQNSLPKYVLSGYQYASKNSDRGKNAQYWSSTVKDNLSAYYFNLNIDPSIIDSTNIMGRMQGISIRCVSRTDDPTMQNVEKWGNDVKEGETKTIPDIRDGNYYTIARLKDGKLWMTQNLRLGDSKLTNRTLTPENTNISSNYTLPTNSTSGFSSNEAENLYVGAPWNGYTSGYYTWLVATAGTGKDLIIDGQNASGSICPKGWRLPTGRPNGELEEMTKKYGSYSNYTDWSNILQRPPINLVLSGYFISSSFSNGGLCGYYWSSTAGGTTFAGEFTLSTSSVSPSTSAYRSYGISIRCVSE